MRRGAFVAFRGYGAEIVDNLALVPDVVAGGEDVGAEVEEVFGDGRREPEAAGSVFRIHDDEVDLALRDDVGQCSRTTRPPGLPKTSPTKSNFTKIVPFLK